MAKTTIGVLNVKLKATTGAFSRGLRNASESAGGMRLSLRRAGIAAAAFAAAAATTAGVLFRLSKEAVGFADDLGNAADSIGIATDELQALRFAGRITSMTNQQIDKSLTKLQRSASEAAEGTAEYADSFRQLGINAELFKRKTPDNQIRDLADAMQGVTDQADRVSIAMTLMGRGGGDMLVMMADGAQGLDKLEEAFRGTGAAMDRDMVAKMQAANAELETFDTMMDGIKRNIGSAFAPSIAALGKAFKSLSSDIEGATDKSEGFEKSFENYTQLSLDGASAILEAGTSVQSKALGLLGKIEEATTGTTLLSDQAGELAAFADVLGDRSLGDRYADGLREANKESREFVENLEKTADLRQEIARQASADADAASTSGPGRFEQIVRSRVSIGFGSGGDVQTQQLSALQTLVRQGGAGAIAR